MLSSGLRKVMKALLILLAAAWITTDADATSGRGRTPAESGSDAAGRKPETSLVITIRCQSVSTLHGSVPRGGLTALHPWRSRAGGRSPPQHQTQAYSS